MMKSKYILIAALIMAVVTTVLFRQYLKELDNKYKNNQNMVEVVVPKVDIKKNQKITKELVELRPYSADAVHAQAIKKLSEVEGSYASIDLYVGQQISASSLTNQFKEKEVFAKKIQEGYRAISIEVNFVESVSTLIEPEDYVDITFSEKLNSNGGPNSIATQPLLENVRVLAVGKRIINKESEVKAENAGEEKAGQVEYNSITVELKPEDILKIANADERGNIKFVLRSKLASK